MTRVPSLETMVNLLVRAIEEPSARKSIIKQFQTLVWDQLDPTLGGSVSDVLRQLAYDLDYFEPDPTVRKEDPSYYGHDRAVREIDDALHKLKDLGVVLPHPYRSPGFRK